MAQYVGDSRTKSACGRIIRRNEQQVRAEVFHTLEGPQDGLLPPPLSNENLLINELVREYLSYNGYANALGVFLAESGQPSNRSLDRGFIKDEVSFESITWCHTMPGKLRSLQAACFLLLLSPLRLVLFFRRSYSSCRAPQASSFSPASPSASRAYCSCKTP